MAYTRKRRRTPEQELDHERGRLEYLRGRLAQVEEVEDNPDGYRLTNEAAGVVIVTDKAEMLSAIRDRIASTENTIARIENDVRRAAGQPVASRGRGVISIAGPGEVEARWHAEERKKLIAGA